MIPLAWARFDRNARLAEPSVTCMLSSTIYGAVTGIHVLSVHLLANTYTYRVDRLVPRTAY